MFNRGGVKGRSSQIGVDDHPGRIDHSAETGLNLKIDFFLEKRVEILKREKTLSQLREVSFTEDFIAHPSQPFPDGFDHDIAGMNL
jgi:hypothetical protein